MRQSDVPERALRRLFRRPFSPVFDQPELRSARAKPDELIRERIAAGVGAALLDYDGRRNVAGNIVKVVDAVGGVGVPNCERVVPPLELRSWPLPPPAWV